MEVCDASESVGAVAGLDDALAVGDLEAFDEAEAEAHGVAKATAIQCTNGDVPACLRTAPLEDLTEAFGAGDPTLDPLAWMNPDPPANQASPIVG